MSNSLKSLFTTSALFVVVFWWQGTAQSATPLAEAFDFHKGTWEEALKRSQTEEKPIFVVFHTSWCGTCKKLKASTLQDADAARFYKENFISVSLDAEEGQGKILAQQWGVKAYPSFVFADAQGKVLYRSKGYQNSAQLIDLGKKALQK